MAKAVSRKGKITGGGHRTIPCSILFIVLIGGRVESALQLITCFFVHMLFSADIKGGDGMPVFDFAVKPDINPQKDRKADGGYQAGGKEAVPVGNAQKGAHQREEIERCKNDNTDECGYLFGTFLFHKTVLLRNILASVQECYGKHTIKKRQLQAVEKNGKLKNNGSARG